MDYEASQTAKAVKMITALHCEATYLKTETALKDVDFVYDFLRTAPIESLARLYDIIKAA